MLYAAIHVDFEPQIMVGVKVIMAVRQILQSELLQLQSLTTKSY
jgi:hypothetical protein